MKHKEALLFIDIQDEYFLEWNQQNENYGARFFTTKS